MSEDLLTGIAIGVLLTITTLFIAKVVLDIINYKLNNGNKK